MFEVFLNLAKLFTGPQLAVLAFEGNLNLDIVGAQLRFCNVDRDRRFALLTFHVLVRVDGELAASHAMVVVREEGFYMDI